MENRNQIIIISLLGTILTTSSVILLIFSPNLISKLINERLAILPENPGYIIWRDMNIPIHQKFYIFNITNVEEILLGAKPVLKEIGPFVYKINISKIDLKYNNNNTEISFKEKQQFNFLPNLSEDLNTTVTILNLPLLSVYKTINSTDISPFLRKIIKFIMKNIKINFFITGTVDELLYKGKRNEIQCIMKILFPKLVDDCYFSLMKNQNLSISNAYRLFTGYDDINLLNTIISYNGSNKLNFWDGDECNDISYANNGELFPPVGIFGSRKQYKFFRPNFCRALNLTLDKSYIFSEVDSLRTDRFKIDYRTFLNSTQYPPNSCYRPKTKNMNTSFVDEQSFNQAINSIFKYFNLTTSDFDQFKSNYNETVSAYKYKEKPAGVFDISPCMENAPIYLSNPHFMDADKYYLQQIDGLKPNKSMHDTFINIEPKTGTPVDTIIRLQVNVDLETSGTSEPKIRSVLFPIMWEEYSIHITKEIASKIELETQTLYIAVYSVSSLLIVIGVIMLIYSLTLFLINIHQQRRAQILTTILNDSNEPLMNEERREQQQQ